MWVLIGFLFLIYGMIVMALAIRSIRINGRITIINVIKILYSLTTGIFAGIVMLLYGIFGIELKLSNLVIFDYTNENLGYMFLYLLLSIIGFFSILIGYKIATKYIKKSSNRLLIINNYTFWIVSTIFMLIGIFGLYMRTIDLGGIFSYIPLASALRGDYENVYGNTHQAMRRIAAFLPISSFLFFFKSLHNKGISYKLFFLVSFVFTILYLLCDDGRLTTVLYFGFLLLGFITERGKKITRKTIVILVLIAFFSFVFLTQMDNITSLIRVGYIEENENHKNILISLMEETLYIYKSAVTSIKYILNGGKLLIFDDIGFGINSIIIGNIGNFTHVWYINTILCLPTYSRSGGSIPVDIIGMSFYDLGAIGVILIPFIYGLFIGFVQKKLGDKKGAIKLTLYYGLMLVAIRTVAYFDFYSFIGNIFPYLILILLLIFIKLLTSNFKLVYEK